MPYHSNDYAYFFANNLYWVVLIPIFILAVWAQIQVKGNFRRYNAVNNRRHMTGAEAARAVLQAHGVHDVEIRRIGGSLTDNYNPRDNIIYLSETVYDAPTIAAVGVACHEAGHAVQYAENYGPVRLRSAIVPATQFSSRFSFLLLILGMILYSQAMFLAGIVLFSITTFFQLVTLPVEFNASHRALETIAGRQLLDDDEIGGARKVLHAAALTYVAALLTSLLQLLRFVMIFFARGGEGGNRRGGGR